MMDQTLDFSDLWHDGHLSDATLLRVADGVVVPDVADAVAAHLRSCARCAATVEEITQAGAVLMTALRQLDASEPAAWREWRPAPARGTAVRRAHERTPRGFWSWQARPVQRQRLRRIAALFAAVTTCIAGVAYATAYWHARTSPAAPTPSRPSRAVPNLAKNAIVVPAPGADFRVRIDSAAPGSRVVVDLAGAGDDLRVEVRGARQPRFQSARGALSVILQRDFATIVVTVPPGVALLRIDANGREVVRVEDGRVVPATARDRGVDVPWY